MINVCQKAVCISCNFQEPLGKVFLYDRVLAAPAFPFFNLFIGKNGMAAVAPVDLGFLLVSQSFFVEDFKKFLCMLVVIFAAGQNFAVPVIRKTEFLLLSCHIVNIGISPFYRSNSVLDCCIFSRHAKRIESHRMDDIKSLHFLETGNNIADRIVSYMAHMEVS